MRRFTLFLLVVMVAASGGFWWQTWRAHATTTTSSTTPTSVPVTTTTSYRPAPICVGGCHAWHPLDTWASSTPLVLATSFAPNPSAPAALAYAAWIRTAGTDIALYPGYKGPGPSTLDRGPMMVPLSGRSRLLATFNSGFYEADSGAGFYVNHTLYFPMRRGLATVVRYVDGTVDVVAWTGEARPGPNVVMARQNLPLLVDRGAPTALVANNAAWGLTLHGAPAVWRTALGVDALGNLVYAAADAQTASGMASVMVQLHVVRAMQLDINPEWPIFVTYAGAGALGPSLFVPNPNQIAGRFLYSSTKDFFAIYVSHRPGGPQPW